MVECNLAKVDVASSNLVSRSIFSFCYRLLTLIPRLYKVSRMSKIKTAFVFPGQGAQKVGMGANLADSFPESAELMERADKALGFSLSRLCYGGPVEELAGTENTQPALLTVSAMALEAFRRRSNIKPDFVAGHSLGEFSALYAAGALSFDDAVGIVRKRGEYMSQASGGVMAAVLGMDAAVIENACREAGEGDDSIRPANYNGAGQTVIAGAPAALERVTPILKERGAGKIIPLNVSAAFHTSYMEGAALKLSADLDAMNFREPDVPLVNNVDAKIVKTASAARDGLKRQVTGAVRWTDIMKTILENEVRAVIEFGPGRTLVNMFKRVDRSLLLLNVEDKESLEKTLEALA